MLHHTSFICQAGMHCTEGWAKVSVQGVVAFGGHFATLCRDLDFYEAKHFFFHYQFSKRKGKYFYTFNHSYSENFSNRAT